MGTTAIVSAILTLLAGIGIIITSQDFKERGLFDKVEEKINFINRTLVDFVVRLSEKRGLSEHDHLYLSTTYRTVRDLERIGDYAENIAEYADALQESGQRFSDDALYEISQLKILIHQLYDNVCSAYRDEQMESLEKANVIEERIADHLINVAKTIKSLRKER
ncbi:MAG: hypothetical protein KBT08_05865 [Bacteroidales bacterium]|nr:hypothetical protein [Candidatus Cryptobacteroides onthequi]